MRGFGALKHDLVCNVLVLFCINNLKMETKLAIFLFRELITSIL